MILTDEEVRLLLFALMTPGPIMDDMTKNLVQRMSIFIASKQISMDVINGIAPAITDNRSQIGFKHHKV